MKTLISCLIAIGLACGLVCADTNINFAAAVIPAGSTNSAVVFQPSAIGNYTRGGIIIINNSSENIYIAQDTAVKTNGVFLVANGGVFQNLKPETIYQGAYAIRSASSNAASVCGIEIRITQ